MVQLKLAIEAVFGSWNNPRAVLYRKKNKISDDLGTAVNVQCMVFGNKGNTSATGVAFTRNPANGAKEFYGDYLVNAQGEDVVAGIRNTSPIAELKHVEGLEEAGRELEEIFVLLENHFHDMMDIEFTIEQGKLFMLQTRVGKRTAAAALHIAIDMEKEGLIDKKEAVRRVAPDQLDQLLHPQFDKNADYDVLARGLNASPGAAVGEAVFSSADAVAAAEAGRKCVLVRWETNPDDLAGMIAAEGILTSHGGKTSHAAVIARGMGAPCVCGVEALKIDAEKKQATVAGTDVVIKEGDMISLDGTSGIVVLGAVDLVMPELTGDLDTILEWADEFRKLGVRANADNPEDAKLSRDFGASGIGLCRTEHMFLGERKQIIQTFILNDDDAVREKAVGEPLRGPDRRLLRYVQGNGRAAGHRAPARSAAARVPRRARARSTWKSRASRRRAGTRPSSPRSACLWSASTASPSRTRCWACAVAASASCTRFSRDAGSRHRDREREAQEGRPRSEARDHDSARVDRRRA